MVFDEIVKNEIKKIVEAYYSEEINDNLNMIEDLSFNSMRFLHLLTELNEVANVDMFAASDHIDEMDTVENTIMVLQKYREETVT